MADTLRIMTESGLELLVEKRALDDLAEVTLRADTGRTCLLHWGLRDRFSATWKMPPESFWPRGTRPFGETAVQSPFLRQNGGSLVTIRISKPVRFPFISFVLYFPDEGRWDNNRGRNYEIALPGSDDRPLYENALGDPSLIDVAGEIIGKEMSRNSWTLMHRFNLCYDLLDQVTPNDADGLALIYVWLRFSFIRQLDWQRNYNTKPRELGHALDRLTLKLTDRYRREPGERGLIRLIMTTLGPGSDAQRVRDEVLHIMHRHHIKEVSGHFMEEWHQKLHNNATPDDLVICEALMEFYRSNGDLNRFYKRLEEGGMTRERLESYERPIRSHPDFIPHLKDALLHDLGHFLGILKEVHAGTDLGTAIHRARYLFDPEMHGMMDFIWHQRDNINIPVSTLAGTATEARRRLSRRLTSSDGTARDLFFLDIALEDFLRAIIERNLQSPLTVHQLIDLITLGVENVWLSAADEEVGLCLEHLRSVQSITERDTPWALQAKAALDRLQRAVGAFTDHLFRLLQPKAEFLGEAFHAAPWTINLFSEEVVRGSTAFVVSMLETKLDPLLRKTAHLGNWQVISHGSGTGTVEVVASLRSVQGRTFTRPVVVVADQIAGDEEIPMGVTAIITPATVDILSHLAIRARNARILFATCYDRGIITTLKSFEGRTFRLSVTATGDVAYEEGPEALLDAQPSSVPVRRDFFRPAFSAYALPVEEFTEQNVGAKSTNLRRLMGRLPEWVSLPTSVALPFGVFEKVLAESANREIRENCEALVRRVDETSGEEVGTLLGQIREAILGLKAPEGLASTLRQVMESSGLPWPSSWDDAWLRIKRVWGSKWNERAYFSRRANGMPHEELFMAVLIQRVVEAEYSFVIHTVNPFSRTRDEIYAEMVTGLGETLAGNYPGKALSFACEKETDAPRLLSFPSKSIALFGSGLIFRSDSNGEDLMGYAGAGLYDSFLLPPTRRVLLNYAQDLLVRDTSFRTQVMTNIARIGAVIEEIMGSPQDIEGAYSKGHYYVVQSRPQVGTEDTPDGNQT